MILSHDEGRSAMAMSLKNIGTGALGACGYEGIST
jgi:hypothetical protein